MVRYNSDGQEQGLTGDQLMKGIGVGVFLFLVVGGIAFFAYAPVYGVWQQEQTGKAGNIITTYIFWGKSYEI